MSRVFITGIGAVSPAGWGAEAISIAVKENRPVPAGEVARPVGSPLKILKVPPPREKFPFMAHPRFRRSSPIAQFTIAAALEALGPDAEKARQRQLRLGVVLSA